MWELIFRFSTLCDDGFRLLLLLEFGSWFMRLIVSSRIWTALHLFANSALLDVLFSSYFFRYLCYWNVRWCYWISGQKVKRLQQWGNDSSIQNLTLDQLHLIKGGFLQKNSYYVFTWKQFHVKSEWHKYLSISMGYVSNASTETIKNESNQWTTIK